MTPTEFRSRFNDMSAGFTSWLRWSKDVTLVSCAVYDSSAHESAWLAAAAADRDEATARLKSFGVHGLKLKEPPSRLTSEELIDAAIAHIGTIVAQLPDGTLVLLGE